MRPSPSAFDRARRGALGLAALVSVGVGSAPGCGARTDVEAPSAAAPGPGPDAGPEPVACDLLRAAGAPLAPFGDRRAEGAHVVARAGGFDVVAFVIGDAIAYHARRIEVRDRSPALAATGVLGPEARSVGALAARGRTLALAYGGADLEGPTRWVLTDDLDYATTRRSTVGPEAGDHGVALAAGPDRWLVGWQDRGTRPLDWAVAAIDDEGRFIGPVTGLASPPVAATRLADGFAWATLEAADRARVRVVLAPDDGESRELAVGAAAAVDALALAPAPEAPATHLEIVWRTRSGALTATVLAPDGTSPERAGEDARPGVLDGPALAPVGMRGVVAVTHCPAGIDGPGRVELRARAGARLETLAVLERPRCPTRPALAALGEVALVAWEEAERTQAQLLSCAP